MVRRGRTEDWVVHREQDDRPFVSLGFVRIVLYDAREDSRGTPAGALAAGGRHCLEVTLANRSRFMLSSADPHPVHLSYRWLDSAGTQLPGEGRRSILPEPLPPAARER